MIADASGWQSFCLITGGAAASGLSLLALATGYAFGSNPWNAWVLVAEVSE